MSASNMTYFEELAWVRMAKSGELARSYLGTDDAPNYLRRLRELAQCIEAEQRAAS